MRKASVLRSALDPPVSPFWYVGKLREVTTRQAEDLRIDSVCLDLNLPQLVGVADKRSCLAIQNLIIDNTIMPTSVAIKDGLYAGIVLQHSLEFFRTRKIVVSKVDWVYHRQSPRHS